MKYFTFHHPWHQFRLHNWGLGRLLLAGCLVMILSSCQNFSPKDPQVSSPDQTKPNLEALELTAQNWQTIKGEGISLSLPESYRGGNPNRNLPEIESALTELQQNYGRRLQTIKQNVENTALIAFDTRSLTKEALTNVSIVQHPLENSIDLEDYLSQAVQQLQQTHQVEEQNIITQNESSQGHIVASTTTAGAITMKQLFYFQLQIETPTEPENILQKFLQSLKQFFNFQSQQKNIWITTYTTPANEFEQRVANFEESIASLQFQT